MNFINTNKLLIITWVSMALLIGAGIGYLLGVKGLGQQIQSPPVQLQQQGFGPGSQGQFPQGQQGGFGQQPQNQGEALPGAPGGRNPFPSEAQGGQQGQPAQQPTGR